MFKIDVVCFWIVFGKVAVKCLAYMHASYVCMYTVGYAVILVPLSRIRRRSQKRKIKKNDGINSGTGDDRVQKPIAGGSRRLPCWSLNSIMGTWVRRSR